MAGLLRISVRWLDWLDAPNFMEWPAIALSSPVPMLFIAERISKSTGLVYGIVLWIAMYTTAVANDLAVATRLKPIVDLSWTTISIIVVFFSLLS